MFNWSVLQRKIRYSFDKVVPALYKNGYTTMANRIAECGHYKELAICSDCGTKYLNGFNTCKSRFCPVCEKKRSYLWLAKLHPIIVEYLQQGYFVNMITLTLVDEDNLENQLKTLSDCWRIMTHDDKSISKEFKSRFIGGLRALEVKRGKNSGLWHSHYHCLVIKDKYSKDFKFLKKSWNKAYSLVTGKNISLEVRVDNIKDNVKGELGAILEVVKYVTKFDWNFDDDVKELVRALKGKRTTSTWGILRSRLSEQNIESDMDMKLSESINLVCKNCGNSVFDYIEGVTSNNIVVDDYGDEL